jgi:hypothetical protein
MRYTAEMITHNGEITREYHYSKNMKTSGRLFSNGIQNVAKKFRGFLMSHTTDIDMKNAHPVILRYICKTHNIECRELDHYVENRDTVLESFPNLTREEAKTLFLVSLNNDKINRHISHPVFRKFDIETKRIQKAIIDLPDYREICDSIPCEKETNIEGSKLNRVLCHFENQILQVALKHITTDHNIEISALMFDGCMVYGDHYANTTLLDTLNSHCEASFPHLNMQWDYKPHDTVSVCIPEGWKSKTLAKIVAETPKIVESKEPITGIMEFDDNMAVDVILENYPHFKYCNQELYVFDNHTGMWSTNRAVINNIIGSLSDKLNIVRQTKTGVENTGRNYANCHNKRKDLYEFIHQKTVDEDWILRTQHTSLGKILFLNGYYDFQKGLFYSVEEYG